MTGALARLGLPLLARLEPERAHELTLRALEAGLGPRAVAPDDPRLATRIWDLAFANPFGIAAGFDKDARVPAALMRLGLGFVEVGTVTPRPQEGNPRPRIFRLSAEGAVINRLGFNNAGHDAMSRRLARRPLDGVIGVNIGANATSTDRIQDYVLGLERFADMADYITVNISSPNTAGLRDLQAPEALDALLEALMVARRGMSSGRSTPLLVKLAPDISDQQLPDVVTRLRHHKVDGIIISNTTISRDTVAGSPLAGEAGGLSGAPLFARATRMLAQIYALTDGQLPLIGVGGIDTGARAVEKIAAGASLVQLYTGLIFKGPRLIGEMGRALLHEIEQRRLGSVQDLIGQDSDRWVSHRSEI